MNDPRIETAVRRYDTRRHKPLLFAEQIAAWLDYRAGEAVSQVAVHLRRTPRQARAILFGGQL